MSNKNVDSVEVITVSKNIPYALIKEEIETGKNDFLVEMRKICEYYKIYREGAKFQPEGTAGDYVASMLRFKKAAQLINREARFLFGETPNVTIKSKGDLGKQSEEYKNNLTVYQDLVTTILDKNSFSKIIMQAAKDCFIGKRVACLVNFNEETGVTVTFHNSQSFVYERDPNNLEKLTKFVVFVTINNSSSLRDKRIFKKKYVLEDNGIVYLEEVLYDGRGKEIEKVTEYQKTKLTNIPACVILNDGLLEDEYGCSEIEALKDYESTFSKISNADIDAERKAMNQIKYTVDMDLNSTKGLKTSPGSYWDLQSNQNLDKPSPQVGTLQSSMEYSGAVDTTLKRVKTEMYDEIEMPQIDIQTMSGVITSGKALKTVYWPLIVRCKEKMKTWGPKLRYIVNVIIEGCIAYPDIGKMYSPDNINDIDYEVSIEQNFPLPEDEIEEKNMDLSEVSAQTMSRKSYMKKWRKLTDEDADEELKQIALERQMLEESYSDGSGGDFQDEEIEIEAEKEMQREGF